MLLFGNYFSSVECNKQIALCKNVAYYDSRVLKIVVDKCQHLPKPVRRVRSVDISAYVADHFMTEHGGENNDFRAWTNVNGEDFAGGGDSC